MGFIFKHATNGYEGTVISEFNQKKKQETIGLHFINFCNYTVN